MDMTIHDFDMARFLTGSEVTEVYAAGGVLIEPAFADAGDIDTAVTTLRFKNGAIGTIDNSRKTTYGYDQRIEALTSRGMFSALNKTEDQCQILDEKRAAFLPSPTLLFGKIHPILPKHCPIFC